MEVVIRLPAITAATLTCLVLVAPVARSGTSSPRSYAHRLTLARWHTEAQWQALDAIVRPESGWDPCSVYPSSHSCTYTGSNSCGIPQASPCPTGWRGRLAATWRVQVDWLIAYIAHRYGTPADALAFRRSHGWY